MRANPELPAEHPDQVGWVGVQNAGCLPERHPLAEPGVEQGTQVVRYAGVRPWLAVVAGPAEMAAEPLGYESQAAFRLERLAGLAEDMMQLVDALPQERVGQCRMVDRLPGEARRQLRELKVDDPLAEARGRGSPPV